MIKVIFKQIVSPVFMLGVIVIAGCSQETSAPGQSAAQSGNVAEAVIVPMSGQSLSWQYSHHYQLTVCRRYRLILPMPWQIIRLLPGLAINYFLMPASAVMERFPVVPAINLNLNSLTACPAPMVSVSRRERP